MSPSPLARIVKIVNFLIAAIVVAALAVVYWCVWRPLPQHSGSIEARVAAPVVVRFDAHGVPHIEASSLEDRSEEHTSELQPLRHLVCRLLLEKSHARFQLQHGASGRVPWVGDKREALRC